MNRTIRYIIKVCILVTYLIILAFVLNSHYIESGECASRVYYYPLYRWDYVMIALIGITMLLSSLHYIRTNKYLRWLECSIYCSIIIITIVFGNSILASKTMDWPDKYKARNINVLNKDNTAIRDTITNVYYKVFHTPDNQRKQIATYERIYLINQDTIFHIKEDFLKKSINTDSLNKVFDRTFSQIFYLDDSRQKSVGGYYYRTIIFSQYNLITWHISSYCKEKSQEYSPHGDCENYFITTLQNDDDFFVEDIFINPDDRILKELVADAIIELRKENWWKNNSEIDMNKWRTEFLEWDISVAYNAAITTEGIVFSFDYESPNLDICYAENYIHAFVPYSKLKGLIKSNYNYLLSGLAQRTINLPDKYHPTSFNIEKRIETQLRGMWIYHAGNVDSDNFLTDTITFAQDNLFYNEDGIFQYIYHIEDNKLFIHRPNRAVKQYKADIVGDTLKLTLLKEAFFEFDVELRQVESSNDTPSPSYKYIKLN